MIHIYYGNPGCGKTTHAAMIVKQCNKKGIPVYSNVKIKGAYYYDCEIDLGKYNISDGVLIIDEASIEYNNRDFKSNKNKQIIYIMKMHRHFNLEIHVYSQAIDDMDITIRRLCPHAAIIRKLGPWSYMREIVVEEGIDENTHQPCSMYHYKVGFPKVFFRPKYYKLFNSWERMYLPQKDFPLIK